MANDKRFFIFKFSTEAECNNILANGPCMVMGKPLFLKKWHKGMEMSKESCRFIPLWIRFYNIPYEYWTAKGFSRVISAVGRPLFADRLTESKARLSYARLCVEVDATKPFVESFQLKAANGILFDIMVCSSCCCFGHLSNICPTKQTISRIVMERSSQPVEVMNVSHEDHITNVARDDTADVNRVETLQVVSENVIEREVSTKEMESLEIPNQEVVIPAIELRTDGGLLEMPKANHVEKGTHVVLPSCSSSTCSSSSNQCKDKEDPEVTKQKTKKKKKKKGGECPIVPVSGFPGLLHNYPSSSLGMILILYDPIKLKVQKLSSNVQAIHYSITTIEDHTHFFVSVIYAFNPVVQRISLWNDIRSQARSLSPSPWVLCGDFNVIKHPNENAGGYVWEQNVHGNIMFQVVCKLKMLKIKLKALNKKEFSEISKRVIETKNALSAVQIALDGDPANVELRSRQKNLFQSFHDLSVAEEQFFMQKSRVKWLSDGDKNTSYFMKTFNAMCNKSRITRLRLASGIQALKEVNSKVVPDQHLNSLTANPSLEEIKGYFFGLSDKKSPGPDEFNAVFFKKTWPVVGNDVAMAVREFFVNGKILKEINYTYLALVPKVPNPTSLQDFRPISCCNTIYKVISKLLAKKIQPILPHLIDNYQTAFIKHRRIGDGVFIVQELMKGYTGQVSSPRCTLKVDIHRAYDTVCWEFLVDCLKVLNFPPMFIQWIIACVTTTAFSVAINGEMVGFFKGAQGLRQGDPISPLLFVLIIDVLSSTIIKSINESSQFSYHWRCRANQIFHLCFADDVILFCHGDLYSLDVLIKSFDSFSKLSGLKPNLAKSNIFTVGVNEETQNTLVNGSGFVVGQFPFRYLGLPITASRLSTTDCKVLVERIIARISSWTSRFLSYAGRLQLIKATLINIHSYWGRHFILPMQPKVYGGLGLPNLTALNRIVILQHIWNLFYDGGQSLWYQWAHSVLIKEKSFWNIKVNKLSSWNWRMLLKLRGLARQFIKHQVGDGAETFLWFDYWLPTGPINLRVGNDVISNSMWDANFKVKGFIRHGQWSFPPLFRNLTNMVDDPPPINDDGRDKVNYVQHTCGFYCGEHSLTFIARWIDNVWNDKCNSMDAVIARLYFSVAIYFIWKERNKRTYAGKYSAPYIVWKFIEDCIRGRLLSLRFKDTRISRTVAADWRLPSLVINSASAGD
ncbi:uncharacterized protein LOC132270455 [Cornus florida]|uniref:uncharacterized protein LOC132270455 n=1 Tax=Cornus florida TaxID=4283 RepID=UPI0028A2921E|nr:uncharacterized protein LOC132270455 [Cornus florida]